MNNQKPLLADHRNKTQAGLNLYSVHSIFYTIQGEGPFAGRPAIFVRLFGCNLQCPGCDTDYTSKREIQTANDILDTLEPLTAQTSAANSPLIVLTGGEPLRQDIVPLCLALLRNGYPVQIESNGTLDLDLMPVVSYAMQFDNPSDMFQLVISPKTARTSETALKYGSAWKYILTAGEVDIDGLPRRSLDMRQRPARPPFSTPRQNIFVQPMDVKEPEQNQANTAAAVASCMKFGYRMSIQTHKILGLE